MSRLHMIVIRYVVFSDIPIAPGKLPFYARVYAMNSRAAPGTEFGARVPQDCTGDGVEQPGLPPGDVGS